MMSQPGYESEPRCMIKSLSLSEPITGRVPCDESESSETESTMDIDRTYSQ
jgi:hypothetical protein